MTLLNNPVALVATTNLIIQIFVLFLLLRGFLLKRQLKFRQHGVTMFVAVVLHLAMLFVIMIPSFVLAIIPDFIFPDIFGITSVVTLVMVVTGALAVSFGVWLVASWRFHDVKSCFTKKRFMRLAMVAWLISLFFGIALYIILYWAVLTA